MNSYKWIIGIFTMLFVLVSCNNGAKTMARNETAYACPMKCEGDKTYHKTGSCPVCKMDLMTMASITPEPMEMDGISEESIFNLTSKWNTEEGNTIALKDLKGKTLVMVMIYTTCKAACPRLVADMRNIEKQIPEAFNKDLQYVLVSIDPKTDTPEHLKAFAKENLMDAEHWTFLQGTEKSVREFANVLAVKYKQISPMDFSHSNIISVFDPQGELVHQQEGLGVDNRETIKKIIETVKK
ncbi:SCO family protein [Flagellimonas onchidii]|uniref:SCO family protein n=1 Tax=Flagellimonas onchidii TaxID=2562684 RepID=UPI001F10633F|nr:SCO family protein [Allomuricauda onchidii]